MSNTHTPYVEAIVKVTAPFDDWLSTLDAAGSIIDDIGELCLSSRKAARLSRQRFADLCGIKPHRLAQIEKVSRPDDPTIDEAVAILEALRDHFHPRLPGFDSPETEGTLGDE